MTGRILLIEDDETFRCFVQTVLEDDGHEVSVAFDGIDGSRKLAMETFDLVVSDLKMPGKSGLELFRETRADPGAPPFIFVTAYGTVDQAVAAMKEGAVDFLTKPLAAPEALLSLVSRILENQLRSRELENLKGTELAGLPPEELIFAGTEMRSVRQLVREVAPTNANVLIYGESGTGKELVARIIHLLSPRHKGCFVPLNCAAIPDNLLESELFGHEKGAFTGAVQARQGKFEMARGGTIFLDEIGEMPLPLQAKLLRVLQERVFERVGGSREIPADVRVVAATNRNLQNEVEAKHFREDLFYRLNVFPIHLPPLRRRADAVPLLAEFFRDRFSRETGKKVKGIGEHAMTALKSYQWPGNVRELQNVLERAVILAQDVIRAENLPESVLQHAAHSRIDPRDTIRKVERDMIVKALEKTRGNRRLAAEELGISRRTLQYRLREYGLLDDR